MTTVSTKASRTCLRRHLCHRLCLLPPVCRVFIIFKAFSLTLDDILLHQGTQGINSVEEALAIIEQFNKIKQRWDPVLVRRIIMRMTLTNVCSHPQWQKGQEEVKEKERQGQEIKEVKEAQEARLIIFIFFGWQRRLVRAFGFLVVYRAVQCHLGDQRGRIILK